MILAAAVQLMAMQGPVTITTQLSEEVPLTEPAYVDVCELQRISGGKLKFEIIQSGRRAYRRGNSDWEQSRRSVEISGINADEFAGLNFNVETEQHYSRSAPAASHVEQEWPANGVAGRGTTVGLSFFPVAVIRLIPETVQIETHGRQRFAATYFRGSGNEPLGGKAAATGFCVRKMQPQKPLSADETARYLAQ